MRPSRTTTAPKGPPPAATPSHDSAMARRMKWVSSMPPPVSRRPSGGSGAITQPWPIGNSVASKKHGSREGHPWRQAELLTQLLRDLNLVSHTPLHHNIVRCVPNSDHGAKG
ncbi:hypothetical protein Rmf_27560 [Roseomonas fluvialis]|uniref:Uncharacterized protein n=1 Tax=Roseomonas fluvialis TaxID=1750527 RepID=A0ABM7Y4P3_9PROT|nr:hypothetical protein Rmf_27560 [Roseomonas fluvialis]